MNESGFSSWRPSRLGGEESSSLGFTLIELLVVIGVVAVLVGVLLPLVSKMYRTSQIVAMKSNFQTIEGALENYKTDFGSYPRNPLATIDPVFTSGYQAYLGLPIPDAYRSAMPRTDPTLAMALIGPGPASALTMVNGIVAQSGYLNGDADGNDGPGFKTQMALFQPVAVTASSGMTTINAGSGASFPTTNLTNPILPPFTVISLGGPGSPDSHLQVMSITGTTVTVATPIVGNYSAGVTAALLTPTGKTWGPYLPVERFKVSYIMYPVANQGNTVYEPVPLPVLLDNWGNPIIYMPAYNTYANHSVTGAVPQSTSNYPTLTTPANSVVSAAPLLGSPSSAVYNGYPAYAYNTPIPPAASGGTQYTGPSIFWSGPLSSFTVGQVAALLYKLGDHDGDNCIDVDPTNGPETLAVQKPYFLMSAGPDGQFLDLYPGVSTPPSGSNVYWQTLVQKSDDVYSFDQ